MSRQIVLSETDTIFSTGVFLRPTKCEINNIETWRWVAVGFEDDCYYDGERINIFDYANSLEGLLDHSEEE